MKKKKTLQYLLFALGSFVVGLILIVVFAVALSGMSTPISKQNSKQDDIISRAASIVHAEESADKAKERVASGMYSVGDYVIRMFISSDYLILDKTDDEFAADLCYVLYGEVTDAIKDDILDYLDGHTRMYAINEAVRDLNRKYVATSSVSADSGDSFENCVVTKPLESSGPYTIGIRKVEGVIETTGNEVRTDFFVDGVFYQGNIKMDDDPAGESDFVMAWDTAGVEAGEHQVLILLRSSDGRGSIISGGQIRVPRCMTLVNDRVQQGSIEMNANDSWYILNAEDRNAYINFVGLSGDIKVTLYDAYGEYVGSNDLENSNYEVLRGHMQDIEAIKEETGLNFVSNNFYVCVERGAAFESERNPVSYTMVQSRNVAYMDGSYYAVIDDVGAVPTGSVNTANSSSLFGSDVQLVDLNNEVSVYKFENINFLPIEGFLTELNIVNTNTGNNLRLFPEFAQKVVDYGYYSTTLVSLNLDYVTQEGYACTSEVTINGEPVPAGSPLPIRQGENVVQITVNTFSGDKNYYTFYILNGSDNGGFYDSTLINFPESYYGGLWLLHNLHPSYNFRAYNTGLSFSEVLDNEDSGSRSLANDYSHPAWCKPDSPVYDGGGWKAARNNVVQYFLDPRNYLDQQHIFAFEMLSFDSSCQTVAGVRNIVNGSFLADTSEYDYSQIIYDAGSTANVSPYFLASRILQEMGYQGQSDLCHGTLPGYEGYYNFYNIGSVPDPSIENGALINGARYAMWGANPDEEEITDVEASLMLPWNSVERAITGGALWIASRYTDAGQDTLYFQKFDVIDNEDGLYEHQYAQNISMAYTEGARYYNGYASINMIDSEFTFVIPVYSNMPEDYGVMPAGY